MIRILFFDNMIRAIYWYRYVVANFPPALVVDNIHYIFEINGIKYRCCSVRDEEMVKIGQPKDTKYYYGMEYKFEKDFEKILKEILE